MSSNDFITSYLAIGEGTEVPVFLTRWCAVAGLGAWLQRDFVFQHGQFEINPNLYSIIIGKPGCRKSTAIKSISKLLRDAGYDSFAADKTTKEKFLLDMAKADFTSDGDVLELDMGDVDETGSTPVFIAADELNDFFGNNNLEFVSLLGSLWDYSGVYKSRVKHGKSIKIPNPTISLLGGNTPTGFNAAFPPEALGQGFFSRVILIFGEESGKKITFPKEPPASLRTSLIQQLLEIKAKCCGVATFTPEGEKLVDRIYREWERLDDVRFDAYANRRLTHLLKLCLIFAASRCSTEISIEDVLKANTLLVHTEHLMPRALGEFGKSKYSAATQTILAYLESSPKPREFKEIFKKVHNDIESQSTLITLLQNLLQADKIQKVTDGYLPKRTVRKEISSELLDMSYLTKEEKGI